MTRRFFLWLASALLLSPAFAHDGHHDPDVPHPLAEWVFWPDYTLSGSAKNYAGNRPEHPRNPAYFLEQIPDAFALMGHEPTEHFWELLKGDQLPTGPFSVEAWMLYHVNQPIGVSINQVTHEAIDWSMGYFDRTMYVVGGTDGQNGINHTFPRENRGYFNMGYKEKWHHLVATYSGSEFAIYYNGVLIDTKAVTKAWSTTEASRLEVTAYMANEDYMQTGNSLNTLALYEQSLDAETIQALFYARSALVEDGRLFDDLFHFTAGPYLSAVTENSIRVLWETDKASTATIQWGETADFGNEIQLTDASRLHRAQVTGLKTNTPYFYEVTVRDAEGHEMTSGTLTFRTSPKAGEPVTFAVIGDTEARPHINDRIAKQVWNERPHSVVLVGDLTDGGTQNHRWQWTHEYFLGMNQLASRIPFLPAPGNGEDDLVWYNHYHNLPGDGMSYYTHRMGDIEFFMLDSNMGHHDRHRPGFRAQQKAWLEQVLQASTAKWKVAAHHHPTYSSDEDDYGDTFREPSRNGDQRVKDDFLVLYEQYGVDVVFFGHLHSYERTWPVLKDKVDEAGVVYVQTGGGGGNHEMAGPTRNWFTNQLYSGYHYALVKQIDDNMFITVRDAEGRLRDQFELTK